MNRWAGVITGVVWLGVVTLVMAPAGIGNERKPPAVRDVMKRAHEGPKSLLASIGRALKAEQPAWAAVQKDTAELVELSGLLVTTAPPQGERESWQKLTSAYRDGARTLDEAARKQDRQAARVAKARIDASCRACHQAHRKPEP
jgi:cytochrome c556